MTTVIVLLTHSHADDPSPHIRLFDQDDRVLAFTQFLDLAEYVGNPQDEKDPGGDLTIEFEGGGVIELYEQRTETWR